ncbi:MAG: FAD-dependent oxidoreductase [Rhodospirillaceae bacterium]|nr:FAD-dependent oxidoreductase [Rhodospirillaceae bacterium]
MPATRRRLLTTSAVAGLGSVLPGLLKPRMARAAEKTDVIIIGAGLAGLKAAIELQEQGAKVLVLEANSRVGGRAFTADHLPGRPELGASQIGPDYARVLDMCTRINVKLGPGSNINAPFAFHVGGRLIKKEEWKAAPENKTAGEERGVLPAALFSFYLRKHMPLKAAEDWLEPAAAPFDVAPGPWLKSKGISDEALRLMDYGISPDVWNTSLLTLMQEEARGMTIFGSSSDASKDRFAQYAETSQHVEGGTSRLPEAMAKHLNGAVLTNKIVAEIAMTSKDVTVRCLDGTSYQADFAISAIPFRPLNRIAINPPLEGMQAEAVRHMPYNNNTQVHFVLKGSPYWEQDGMDASIWSDGPVTSFRQSIGYDGSRTKAMAFCVGKKGDRIDQMAPKDRAAFVVTELERMRPSMKGKLEITGVHSWPQYMFVEGCRHSYGPGQVTRWAADMIKPHGRIHFAGEHTRRLDVGMESAMESGERAAIEIITRMQG